MSTPEIDLRNMLDAEDAQERLDDAYQNWLENTVINDLTKYLSVFDCYKFDKAVEMFEIKDPEGIVSWLWESVRQYYGYYQAIVYREWDDIDVRYLVEKYINCFVCEQDFIDYNNKVTLNDY
jgi:hypothetical protein